MLTMEGVPKNERQDKFGFRFGRSTLRGDTLSPITDEVPLLARPPRPLVPPTVLRSLLLRRCQESILPLMALIKTRTHEHRTNSARRRRAVAQATLSIADVVVLIWRPKGSRPSLSRPSAQSRQIRSGRDEQVNGGSKRTVAATDTPIHLTRRGEDKLGRGHEGHLEAL